VVNFAAHHEHPRGYRSSWLKRSEGESPEVRIEARFAGSHDKRGFDLVFAERRSWSFLATGRRSTDKHSRP
jgi:hypothetical protein